MVDVYAFFDYPGFLAEFFKERKANDHAYSHRVFLKTAGIPGSMYLKRVIARQRKLSLKYVEHFITALKLTGKKAEYFRLLVKYGNEKKPLEKQNILKELVALRDGSAYKLANRHMRYFEKWYYPVIRELAVILDFHDNFNELANAMVPRISPVQAKYAIGYLVKNGFLKRDGTGRYSQTQTRLTTGPEVDSTILAGFHRNNLLIAADAINTVPRMERDISSLTLGVSQENYAAIKKEIQQFRKRLLALAGAEKKPELVCHVGLQLLPRSKIRKGSGR
jgi:uncharacterized protein (TIGR02147 family)